MERGRPYPEAPAGSLNRQVSLTSREKADSRVPHGREKQSRWKHLLRQVFACRSDSQRVQAAGREAAQLAALPSRCRAALVSLS